MQKTPRGVPLHLPNNQQQWLNKSAILTVRDVNIIMLLSSKYICLQCIHRKKYLHDNLQNFQPLLHLLIYVY